jgi:glycine cleavage system regulatory protein
MAGGLLFEASAVVTVDSEAALESVRAALEELATEILVDVSVRSAASEPVENAGRRQVRLELLGHDRPGIVAAVSGVLARHGLGVADLQTATRAAPMAGGLLFEASAVVTVDSDAALDAVRTALEELATEILVDVTVVELG